MTNAQRREKYLKLYAIADRIRWMRRARAERLAATVQVPYAMIHNASIDTGLKGWCHNNPKRLKVAKAARRIADSEFDGYSIMDAWCARNR